VNKIIRNFLEIIRNTELYFRLFKKRKVRMHIEGSCKMTGNCCKNLILLNAGNPVTSEKAFKKLVRRIPEYKMFIPNGDVTEEGYLRYTCSNLTSENKCGIYANRPEICRRYPDPRMLKYGCGILPGCGYRIVPKESFESLLKDADLKQDL